MLGKQLLLTLTLVIICNIGFGQKKSGHAPRAPKTAKDIEQLTPQGSYALPWVDINDSNIIWKRRVWRTIDADAIGNGPFLYNRNVQIDNDFVNILVQGVFDKRYKAYSPVDDRFTTEMAQTDFMGMVGRGLANADNSFKPEQVKRYRVKEDWMLLKEEKKVVVRIAGIAPLYNVNNTDGGTTELTAFWLYYPDIRQFLAEHMVLTGTTAEQEMNWDQLLEARKFTSTIEKVSGKDVDK